MLETPCDQAAVRDYLEKETGRLVSWGQLLILPLASHHKSTLTGACLLDVRPAENPAFMRSKERKCELYFEANRPVEFPARQFQLSVP